MLEILHKAFSPILPGSGEWKWYSKLGISVAMMVPVLGIGTYSYLRIDQELTAGITAERRSIASLSANLLEERFERILGIGVSLATRVQFRQLVQNRQWTEAVRILEEAPHDFPFLDRLFLSDTGGTVMADVPSLPGSRGTNFAHRDWYQGVRRSWQPYLSEAYRRQAIPRLNVIAFAVPIFDNGPRPSGILVMQVLLDTLMAWTGAIDVGGVGGIYAVDQRGRLATNPQRFAQDEVEEYTDMSAVGKVLEGKSGVGVFPDPRTGVPQLVAYQPVARFGWSVLVEEPASSAFARRDQSLRFLVVLYSGLVFVNLVLVGIVVRSFEKLNHAGGQIVALNQDLALRASQLESVNKELEAFSYTVSHDLRAPLRHIGGFVGLLQQHATTLDDKGRRYLGIVVDAARRMGVLIDDLLAFSRMGRVDMMEATVNLDAMVEESVRSLNGHVGGRQISWAIGPLGHVRGDRAMLRLVVENLLSNAVKYSVRSPLARIEMCVHEEVSHESMVTFMVRDNGVGFDPQYASKLFGVFQRLHSEHEFEGTGIGLATVRRIIQRHQGTVWAEGRVNEGAAFYFTLRRPGEA